MLDILFFFLFSGLFLAVFSLVKGIALFKVLTLLQDSFFTPQYNLMFVTQVEGINTNILLIFLIACGAVGIFVSRHWFKRRLSPLGTVPPLILSTGMALGMVVLTQSYHYLQMYQAQSKVIAGRNLDQKNALLFGKLYEFPTFCHKHLHGKRQVVLMTGFDPKTTTGRHDYLVLTYYLYPLLAPPNPWHVYESAQKPRPVLTPPETYLIFEKDNPEKLLPRDSKIVARWNAKSLIAEREYP